MRTLVLMYLAACSGQKGEPAPKTGPTAIEVRDGNKLVAQIVPGHPCKASIDSVDVQVDGPPVAAQVGSAAWTGDDGDNGTTILDNGEYVARLYSGTLYDGQGVAIVRVAVASDTATVSDAGSRVLRTLMRRPDEIIAGTMTVTGTNDLGLAAILTAKEARPEVRALAACRMLFGASS